MGYFLVVVLLLAGPAWAAQDCDKSCKCGRVLVSRAERAFTAGRRVVRAPRFCAHATLPPGYTGRAGLHGDELWQGVRRVVLAIDTVEHPLEDPPLRERTNGKPPKPQLERVVITSERWRGDTRVTRVEEYRP